MIGNFARMFRENERVEEVAPNTEGNGYDVTARTHGDVGRTTQERDGPPEAFVERVSDDGGDVFVIPFMEALRAWLKHRRETDASAEAQTDGETVKN